jgi:recombination protein RecA
MAAAAATSFSELAELVSGEIHEGRRARESNLNRDWHRARDSRDPRDSRDSRDEQREAEESREALSSSFASTLARFGVLQGTSALLPPAKVIDLGWPELERILPDRGLPRGVTELAMPMKQNALRGGATTIALSAVRAIHHADDKAWCAWITPTDAPSLYAPQVAQAEVDLDRLLVVRPEPAALARTVVKVAASGAFDLVVVDALTGLDGKLSSGGVGPGSKRAEARRVDGSVVVRKLALASEEQGTAFVVITNAYAPRAVPWPVALRLEVERRPEAIAVRVTKDRLGRAASHGSAAHVVRVAS